MMRNFGVQTCEAEGEQQKVITILHHAHSVVTSIVCFLKSSSVYPRCVLPLGESVKQKLVFAYFARIQHIVAQPPQQHHKGIR